MAAVAVLVTGEEPRIFSNLVQAWNYVEQAGFAPNRPCNPCYGEFRPCTGAAGALVASKTARIESWVVR